MKKLKEQLPEVTREIYQKLKRVFPLIPTYLLYGVIIFYVGHDGNGMFIENCCKELKSDELNENEKKEFPALFLFRLCQDFCQNEDELEVLQKSIIKAKQELRSEHEHEKVRKALRAERDTHKRSVSARSDNEPTQHLSKKPRHYH